MIRETKRGFLEDDNMSFNEFKKCLMLLEEQEKSVHNGKSLIRATNKSIVICESVRSNLEDDDCNFVRWLNKMPCVLRNRNSDSYVSINIGGTAEGIYRFLIYRKLIKHCLPIDWEFLMALLNITLKA